MKKKALIMAIISAAIMTSASAATDYSDVENHWALRFINRLTDEGVVEGFNNNFRPDSSVNVDEFLKMTLSAMNVEITPNKDDWSKPYIDAALSKKLIYKNEFTSYNRPITRGEIAKICTRAIDANEVTGAAREALINQISDYYDIMNDTKEYVLAAYNHQLIYGYSDNSFKSEHGATRAEACVIVSRMEDAGDFTIKKPDDIGVLSENIYYVSPDGSDTNDGSLSSPFNTLEKARDKVREIIASGEYPKEGITICLRGGDYKIEKGLELGAQDSGTEGAPVIYTSYQGETARITGGVKLPYSSFEAISGDMASKILDKNAAGKVLQLDLAKLGITELGKLSRRGYIIADDEIPQAELYVNGSRMQLARWPNNEWVGTTGIVRSGARSKTGVMEGAVYKIDYDRPTKWKTNIDEIYTSGVLGPNYFYGYFPIEKIEAGQITLREGSVTDYYSKHFIKYENIFEEIDEPGEYYIDRKTGMLYFYPTDGFSAESDICLSQIGENIISGSNVKNVTFKNLKFEASRAVIIRINDSEKITVENCEISGTGTNGVYLKGTDCVVKNCLIHDIGSTGVSISGGDYNNIVSSGNVVTNNKIYKAAQIERSYQAGVLVGYQSVGINVSHNEIYDMPHTAVIVYGPNHTIEYNNIYDAVKEFHDMDAIYMNVYQYPWERNVLIRRNYIHDLGQQTFTEKQMNVAGIRTDNNGNGLNVIENVFYNIGYQNANGIRGVCAQGIENVVKNNIFVDTSGTYEGAHTYNPDAKWDLQSASVKPIHDQWSIYNSKYSEQNPEVAHFFEHHFAAYEKNNVFSGNVIVNIKFPLSTLNSAPAKEGFFAAEQLVEAENNLVTKQDPGFADYANKDFTLKEDSEVYKQIKDFPKIDFNNIGNLKDETVGVTK